MGIAALLGLVHAVTDAATITTLYRATGLHSTSAVAVFGAILAYDLLAFGGQPLIGVLVDRVPPARTMLAGLAVTATGVAVATLGREPSSLVGIGAVLLAAVGNAVTHLGAGVVVLRGDLTRATPAGLLVAPGALGLGFGLWFGRDVDLGATWLLVLPVVLAAWGVVELERRGSLLPPAASTSGRSGPRLGEPLLPVPARGIALGALILLLISVAIRALVGSGATRGYEAGAWLTLGVPLVAFAGKALGGVVADRVGWLVATVGALALSAPVLAVKQGVPALLLAGLLVFQMTMPVTLVAVARLLPGRPATAFGLPCLALAVGGLPAMFAWGADMVGRPALGAWVAVSAVAAWAGLTGAGFGWGRGGPGSTDSDCGPVLEPATEPASAQAGERVGG